MDWKLACLLEHVKAGWQVVSVSHEKLTDDKSYNVVHNDRLASVRF